MAEFGYTAVCEQSPVRQLVTDLVRPQGKVALADSGSPPARLDKRRQPRVSLR